MQLYRVSYVDERKRKRSVWSPSKVSASKTRTTLKHNGADPGPIEAVDVPTKKEELIAWLNENQ